MREVVEEGASMLRETKFGPSAAAPGDCGLGCEAEKFGGQVTVILPEESEILSFMEILRFEMG